jgi:hypothetical protein
MIGKNRCSWWSALAAAAGLLLLSARAVPAAEKDGPIDFSRARQLFSKSQRGEKLTSEEQADLERALAARGKKPGSEQGAGGTGPRAVKEPPRMIDYDPAPLPEVHLPAARPRIWFTAAELLELRKRCQSTHQNYLNLVVNAAQGHPRPAIRAFNLAFLYQITGEAGYARQAIELARHVKRFDWVRPNEMGLPYGEWYAGYADPLACVFDWCFDQLSAEERKAIGAVLREELAHGPYHTQFHECFWIPAWVSQTLALWGAGVDDKLAADSLVACNRAMHQLAALADEIHADSAIGTYHYQYKDFFFYPELWLRATGENLFEKCGFYRAQPEYLLYTILPEGRWLANDGDGPTDASGGLGKTHLPSAEVFHFYGLRNNNAYSRWLGRRLGGGVNAGWERPWQAILWADDSGDEKPLGDLPPVRLFPSNQVAVMRSGWNLSAKSTDIVAAFYCRPYEVHTHFDAGHYVIWRGLDLLAGRNGFYAGTQNVFHHNFFTRTPAHNCVLIYDPEEKGIGRGEFWQANDGGQTIGDPAPYLVSNRLLKGFNPYRSRGQICNFVDERDLTYLYADISPAYNAEKAAHLARAFLWLKPATFVVCDRVAATKAQSAKRWVLNTATKPSADGGEKIVAGGAEAGILENADVHLVTLQRGRSTLFLQPLLPERPLVRRIGGEGYSYWCDGKNWEPPLAREGREDRQRETGADHFWRIEIEPTEPAADVVFLNVLDAAAADAAAPPSATVLRRAGGIGAALKHGDASHEVLFYPDGRASVDGKPLGRALEPLKSTSRASRRD